MRGLQAKFVHLLHGSLQELAVVTRVLHAYDAVRILDDSSRTRQGCDVPSFMPACNQHDGKEELASVSLLGCENAEARHEILHHSLFQSAVRGDLAAILVCACKHKMKRAMHNSDGTYLRQE
jgi:hypothetical protein